MLNMTESSIIAIIGVCGTLLGTILGWFLSKVKLGKIRKSVSEIEKIDYGRHHSPPTIYDVKGKLYYYAFGFTLSLYNTSDKNKTLRDFQFVFCNKGKELFRQKLNEKNRYNTWREDPEPLADVINIEGFSGMDISGFVVAYEVDKLFETTNCYIAYKDEKFKTKKVKVRWKQPEGDLIRDYDEERKQKEQKEKAVKG